MNVHLVGDAVVQTAMVVDDVVHNPGGGRAADNQLHITLPVGPSVPKQIQCLHQSRTRRVETRQFVDKDDGRLVLRHLLHHLLQGFESLIPPSDSFTLITTLFESHIKRHQLVFLIPINDTCHVESQGILECLRDEKSLAHTPSSIDCDELRAVTPMYFRSKSCSSSLPINCTISIYTV